MSFLNFPKFFLAEPGLTLQMEANVDGPDANRPLALMLLAYDVVTWFDQSPALNEVRVTCVVKPVVSENGLDVRVYHHLKITGDAKSEGLPSNQDEADAFVAARIPWKLMGNGSMQFKREDPLIAAALQCSADDGAGIRVALFALADQMDHGFQTPSVIHDLGLSSVFKG